MEKLKINALKIAIVAVMLPAALVSCKKDEIVVSKDLTEKTDAASINVLKTFFAKHINAKEDDITYDEKSEQFKLWGIDQVSKTQLIRTYENSKNVK